MLFANLTVWLPPIWLVSTGIALGLAVLAILFGIVALVSRNSARSLWGVVREGFLTPILALALFLTGVALISSVKVPYGDFFRSMMRLPGTGEVTKTITVVSGRSETVNITPRVDELQSVQITSDTEMTVRPLVAPGNSDNSLRLDVGQRYAWIKGTGVRSFMVSDEQAGFIVSNPGTTNGRLELTYSIQAEQPEAAIIPISALSLLGLVGGYLLLRWLAPKVTAVALTTAKEAVSQPLFYLALALGSFALLAFVYIPYNTFGEDVKMLKDSGLTLIMVLSIVVAVWTASVSVADEIEGKTALTVLSKPIGRRQFLIGKYMGILLPAALIFLFLGLFFMASVSFKVVHDAREGAKQDPTWQLCTLEMMSLVPGLVLGFLETAIMAAISVAISTRLPMLANLMICSMVYVLGHLVPLLGNSKAGEVEIVSNVPVRFIAQFFATIFPVLDHFNIQGSIAAGASVSLAYLAWALLYCVLYSSVALLLALALFEDRDLA